MRSIINTTTRIILFLAQVIFFICVGHAQPQPTPLPTAIEPVARFEFDDNFDNATGTSVKGQTSGSPTFVRGLNRRALRLRSGDAVAGLTIEGMGLPSHASRDFSVQYWISTTASSESRMVLLSQKDTENNSLASQKVPGWVFFMSHGSWAWNMGSGERRLTYERDNGEHMPLNDGRWHQLTMTYDSALTEVRLYYDGVNKTIYNLSDSEGFDFTSTQALIVGGTGKTSSARNEIVPAIYDGAEKLQQLVDVFNAFELDKVEPDEFVKLIVEPEVLFDEKVRTRARTLGAEGESFIASMRSADFTQVSQAESALMQNPYTVHQVFSFMDAAPLMKIFSLVDDKVVIDNIAANVFSERERLYPTDFDIDNLAIWERAVSAKEIRDSYSAHFEPVVADHEQSIDSITTGIWNIFHGGLHFSVDEHGWDARLGIAQILDREGIDVLMMQETYSAGDFIAAELGYYFATTVDLDYLNQGSNISVLSRYPIRELLVPEEASFNNVAVRVAISETQDVWVISNWYGMEAFPPVFEFHQSRFADTVTIPVFFGGDFNAVPHIDGGDSPASKVMMSAGFTDAYRSLYPDVGEFPGVTYRNKSRIDQLYYKGTSLHHTSTRLVNSWPAGFPSDHYLLRSVFELR